MKIVTMSTKKEDTLPVVFAEHHKTKDLLLKWKVTICVTAVVLAVVVVAGIVFAAIQLSNNTPDATVKEYHTTYYDRNSVTKETVYMDNREEKYVLQDATAIFDFNTGFVTYKLNEDNNNCYLSSFNLTDFQSPQQLRSEANGNEMSFVVESHMDKQYIATDIWVNQAVLGRMARSLCDGNRLYMLRDVTGVDNGVSQQTRAVDIRIKIKIGRVKIDIRIRF